MSHPPPNDPQKPSRRRQQRLLVAGLILHGTIRAAADHAKISRATAKRWMRDDEFRAMLRAAQDGVVRAAVARMSGLANKGLSRLVKVMDDPDTPPAVVVQAVATLWSHISRFREHLDLTAEVERLTKEEDEHGDE